MSKTNTGGPAFPLKQPMSNDLQGMTLRDYFAAKAMEGLLAAGRDAEFPVDTMYDCAKSSYSLADAMLIVRDI